jgi:hypothetical protein
MRMSTVLREDVDVSRRVAQGRGIIFMARRRQSIKGDRLYSSAQAANHIHAIAGKAVMDTWQICPFHCPCQSSFTPL